jgi:uncharacterized membrane protein YadS
MAEAPKDSGWKGLFSTEDWLAVWIGGLILAVAFASVWVTLPEGFAGQIAAGEKPKLESPLLGHLAKPGNWRGNPVEAIHNGTQCRGPGILGAFAACLLFFGAGVACMGKSVGRFAIGFPFVFALATFAYLLSGQELIEYYNLEYVIWALAIGLLISNTIGTPALIRPAVQTEFYIKVGLVLLGGELLLQKLLALGVPGIFVSWVTTPIVLITTYWFGQKILRMESPSLNMVISADMSVCGVSAAIATAAACKAKKEELSLAVGLSLTFTAIMMVVMPAAIKALGMGQVLGGAWIGGTIDSTGAVAAAGGFLGPEALTVAATVKMIQNILIGVIAFGVAVYWTMYVDRDANVDRPGIGEIWKRFPKFVIGFVLAALVASLLSAKLTGGSQIVSATTGVSKLLRNWLFCLAFVSIGLETNFRELAGYLKGGKALTLYVAGQSLNLALTLFMAWLMFYVVFPDAAKVLAQ